MSNLILLGATDACGGLLPLVKVVYAVIKVLMILIPIALIIFGMIDLGKAVISSEDKEVKAATSRLVKRFVYAAVIFFVPVLVAAVMNLVAAGGEGNTTGWEACWNAAKE